MSIVAHLSDLHLIEREHHKRGSYSRRRLWFLSAGSPLDARARMHRTAASLQAVRRSGADHLVITGDLTEDGVQAQFEVLAEVLHDSGIDPHCVTLTPGNHDGYAEPGAFERALEGPLRVFRKTSRHGAHTVLNDAVVAPVSTMIEGQWIARAGGMVRHDDVRSIRKLASDSITRGKAVVVAQHHPPSRHTLSPVSWFDDVSNADAMRDLVLERTRVHVLHGHMHRTHTRRFCGRHHAQVYATASVRDEFGTGQTLRLYKAADGALHELSSDLPLTRPAPARSIAAPALGWAAAASS